MLRRSSGILMHLTSLPSRYGIGDMGPEAHRFVEILAAAHQGLWQVLPLYPTDPAQGNSPYSSASSFAGNPLLISPDLLVEEGLLLAGEIPPPDHLPSARVDYPAVEAYKRGLLEKAFQRFRSLGSCPAYERFCARHAAWLEPFATFMALKALHGGRVWGEWPREVRDREPAALRRLGREIGEALERHRFLQYVFDKQWQALREHCLAKGVQIIGDVPIYVNYDSAEVWSHPNLFQLGDDRRPRVVAGVPPDYFSETGQLWGNPLYDWQAMQAEEFAWWVLRLRRAFALFDWIRIDHFRGLVAYWEVPAGERTAVRGRWVDAPVDAFFGTLFRRFPVLPVIAEDLGVITAEVRDVVRRYEVPGMRVLLFAFADENPAHPYLPHTFPRDCVVYTGTHDNNTARGWYEHEARPEDRQRLARYLGREVSAETASGELIRAALMSVADMCIVPLQDALGLGEEARMNRPSTGTGNWEWRLPPEALTPAILGKLAEMTVTYGRA